MGISFSESQFSLAFTKFRAKIYINIHNIKKSMEIHSIMNLKVRFDIMDFDIFLYKFDQT